MTAEEYAIEAIGAMVVSVYPLYKKGPIDPPDWKLAEKMLQKEFESAINDTWAKAAEMAENQCVICTTTVPRLKEPVMHNCENERNKKLGKEFREQIK